MISIAEKSLNLLNFKQIVEAETKIQPAGGVLQQVADNHAFLKSFADDKLIYGINTGFGPMAQYKVSDDQRLHLQYNLIRSHAAGSGQRLSDQEVRAMMLARLNSLMQSRSGVHPDLITLLTDMINLRVYPVIPEHGGVGASGDLVQLAHLALGLIGEGEVSHGGEIIAAGDAMNKLGIRPLTMHLREGLALLNGTSAMTGIGMLNLSKARTLLQHAILLSALTNEVVEAFDDHLSEELNKVKHHSGQQSIATAIRSILADSKMMRKRPDHLYRSENLGKPVFEEKIRSTIPSAVSRRCWVRCTIRLILPNRCLWTNSTASTIIPLSIISPVMYFTVETSTVTMFFTGNGQDAHCDQQALHAQ